MGDVSAADVRKVLAEAGIVRTSEWQKTQVLVLGVSDLTDGIVLSCKIPC